MPCHLMIRHEFDLPSRRAAPRRPHWGFGAQIAQAARLWRRVVDHRHAAVRVDGSDLAAAFASRPRPGARCGRRISRRRSRLTVPPSFACSTLWKRAGLIERREDGADRRAKAIVPDRGSAARRWPRSSASRSRCEATPSWDLPRMSSRPLRMSLDHVCRSWRRWPTSPGHESPPHGRPGLETRSKGRAVTSRCGCLPCSL